MKNPSWQSAALLRRSHLHSSLVAWLVHKGSFMQRLKQFGVTEAQIVVISQQWEVPARDERKLLKMTYRHYAVVREVIIKSQQGAWMFARTVIPRKTLTGKEQQLAHLKTRSLGSKLFNDPTMTRSDFEFALLTPQSFWYKKIENLLPLHNKSLWARRSVFHIQQKSLLLTEVFMHDVIQLQNNEENNVSTLCKRKK